MPLRLDRIPALRVFPEKALNELRDIITVERYSAGDIVFEEGTPGSAVYFVESGEIGIRKEDRELSLVSCGNMFGEMALFEGLPRSAAATATKDAVVYKINNSEFKKLIMNNPRPGVSFLFDMIGEVSRRLRRTSEYLVTVYDTSRIISSECTLADMARALVERLLAALGATGGILLIHNRFTGYYDTVFSDGCVALDPRTAADKAEAAGGKRIDYSNEGLFLTGEPLNESGRCLGYIIFERSGSEGPFTDEQKITLSTVASQAGLGILKAFGKQESDARRRLEQGRTGGL